MQTIILAAGKGSRLHPITLDRSKAMLPILGRPIVARVMETLVENGLRDFVLVVSSDDREIVNYFEAESGLDVRVQFAVQTERRGMADALFHAAALIQGDFLLTACDNLVSGADIGQMLALWKSVPELSGILALMKVSPEKIKNVGIVELEGEWVRRIVEKPDPAHVSGNTASMPLYIFSNQILAYLPEVPHSPRGEYELQDAIQMLIERDGRVYGYPTAGRQTLTSPADLLDLNRHYLISREVNYHASPQSVGEGTKLLPPLYIEAGVEIGAGCVVGPNIFMEYDCKIGDEVVLRESVLLREVTIPAGEHIEGQVVS
jgi:NDP-sugar pyrophosphorylase family protein